MGIFVPGAFWGALQTHGTTLTTVSKIERKEGTGWHTAIQRDLVAPPRGSRRDPMRWEERTRAGPPVGSPASCDTEKRDRPDCRYGVLTSLNPLV